MEILTFNNRPFVNFVKKDCQNTLKNHRTVSFPAVNVLENENDFNIELAAPSYEKSDFKIDIDKNILTISTQKSEENQEEGEKYTRIEFAYNGFKRSFTLSDNIKQDEISADYQSGILTVKLPKVEKVQVAIA